MDRGMLRAAGSSTTRVATPIVFDVDFVGRSYFDVSDSWNGHGQHVWKTTAFASTAEWNEERTLVRIESLMIIEKVCDDAAAGMKDSVGKGVTFYTVYRVDEKTRTMKAIGGWTYEDERTTLPDGTFGKFQGDNYNEDEENERVTEISGWKIVELTNGNQVMLRHNEKAWVDYNVTYAQQQSGSKESFDPTAGVSICYARPSKEDLNPLCPLCVGTANDNTGDLLEETRQILACTNFIAPGMKPTVTVVADFISLQDAETTCHSFSSYSLVTMKWPITRLDIIDYVLKSKAERAMWVPSYCPPELTVNNVFPGTDGAGRVTAKSGCEILIEGENVVATQSFRVSGRFHESFELENFPFDTQPLAIHLSVPMGEDDLVFKFEKSDKTPHLQTTEWLFKSKFSSASKQGIVYGIVVARQYKVYLYRIQLIMSFFALVPLSGFALDAHEATSDRLGISITMLLTCTAYSLVVSTQLPTLGYLTLLDQHILGVFASTLAITLQFAAVSFLNLSPSVDKQMMIADACAIGAAHLLLVLYIMLKAFPSEARKIRTQVLERFIDQELLVENTAKEEKKEAGEGEEEESKNPIVLLQDEGHSDSSSE